MAEYVCELTDDYPDVPYGDDEYSGALERRERIVRCLDCTRCERVGDMAYCHHFRLYVPPRGFCWAGEPR